MDEYLAMGMVLSPLFYEDFRDCTPYSVILTRVEHRQCARDSPDVFC